MPTDKISLVRFRGLDLGRSVLKRQPGSFIKLRNGQVSFVKAYGGLEKRGGLAPMHDDALSGPILNLENIPLGSSFDPAPGGVGVLFAQVDDGLGFEWFETTLAVFTSVPGLGTQEAATAPSTGSNLMVVVDDTGSGFELVRWDGTTRLVLVAASAWPTIAGATLSAVAGTAVRLGVVYVAATYSNDFAYVLAVSLSSGTITVLGNGPVAAVNQTAERMHVSSDGQCYMAVVGLTAGSAICRFDLASSGPWIIEAQLESPFVNVGSVTALAEYGGEMYAAVKPVGAAPYIVPRTNTSWSTVSHTFATATSTVLWLGAHGGLLLAGVDGPAPESEVWAFDGATWALDDDILSTFTVRQTAVAAFSWSSLVVASDNDTILARTAAGVWSESVDAGGAVVAMGVVG